MTFTATQTQKVNAVLDDMFSSFEDLDLVFEEIAEEKKNAVSKSTPKIGSRIEYVNACGVTNILTLETESMLNDWNDIKTYSVKLLKDAIKRYEEKYSHLQDFMIMEFALGLKLSQK